MDIAKLKTLSPPRKMFPWSLEVGAQPQAGTSPQEPQPSLQAVPVTFEIHLGWHILPNLSVVFGEECKRQAEEGSFSSYVLLLPCNPWRGDFLCGHLSSGSGCLARLTTPPPPPRKNPPTPVPIWLSHFPLHCTENPTLSRLPWQAELLGAPAPTAALVLLLLPWWASALNGVVPTLCPPCLGSE